MKKLVLGIAAAIAATVPVGGTPATMAVACSGIEVPVVGCVYITASTNCAVNVGTCDPYAQCKVNVGYCANGGRCTVNVGHCRSGDADLVRL